VTTPTETTSLLVDAVYAFGGTADLFARDWSVEELAIALVAIRDVRASLAITAGRLEKELASASGEKRFTVEGLGEFEVKGNVRRVKWDREELLRAVMDSRLVNEATGEITDETPVDKVLQVWNLGAPRVMALRARGLDPDEFCEATFEGWQVRLP
jgi:hypothetical protein